MPCRYFSFPRIKSISVSSKCCPPPRRWQKRAPTFLHRLAPLSALHPLLCPSGQLKRKNIGVTAKERANCRSCDVSPARRAKPGDAQLLPYLAGSPPFPKLALFHPHLLPGFISQTAAPPPCQQHLPSRRRCGAPGESVGEMLLPTHHAVTRPDASTRPCTAR